MQITVVTPRLPSSVGKDRRIRLTVVVTAGATAIAGATLQIRRGNPLVSEAQLSTALSTAPPTDDVDIPPVALTGVLAAYASRTVVLSTTSEQFNADGTQGLCLSCRDGVYPVDVVLSLPDTGTDLARAHSFLPFFQVTPKPVQVSWIWPLLDGPHRGASTTVFDDDALATSVSAGGRLDRALRVAELVAGTVRLTIIVDPDLIDSLVVMSTHYEVRQPGGGTVPGTGSHAAKTWLTRLAAVAPSHDLVRTAYADPDVDSLARDDVSWPNTLDVQVTATLKSVLGVDPGSALSWPIGETLSGPGLDAVVGNGAAEVLLSDKALPGALGDAQTPDAVAPLPAASGRASALVLSSALQATVATAMNPRATVTAAADRTRLLAAQLAVRAVADPSLAHYVVLAPARYVDVQPDRVADLMQMIAAAPFAHDLAVTAALHSVVPADHGPLVPTAAGGLSPAIMATLADTRTRLDSLRECLRNDDAATLLGAYPTAVERGESSYWRMHPDPGLAFAGRLRNGLVDLAARVHITSPPNASYTLASSDAPLFVTVANTLPVRVSVGLRVEPAPGERGLVVHTVAAQQIPPGTHQFKVPTRVERTGRFKVLITLVSPGGQTIGEPSPIRVKSTAFGAVGLWITGVALGVLVVALVIRTVRRLRNRSSRPSRENLAAPTGLLP